MVKQKQLRARVDDDIYNRVQNKTNKMSDFVREAIIEKLEKEEYGNESTVNIEIRQLELLIESRQTIISQYQDLIKKEENECKKIQSQIDEKKRILEQKVNREEKIKKDPKIRKEFENAVMFLLSKKYLQLDANVERVLNSKAENLNYSRTSEFKEDLKKYIKEEYKIGKTFNVDGQNKEIIQQDIDYMIHRL